MYACNLCVKAAYVLYFLNSKPLSFLVESDADIVSQKSLNGLMEEADMVFDFCTM